MRYAIALSAAALLLAAPVCALAGEASEKGAWSRYADEETVTAITTDEDGSVRETTIWLVVVDGAAYIRTGKTRWGGNVERETEILLRVATEEIPVRVRFVMNEDLRRRVIEAFRAKYGFTDGLLDIFRGRNPKIMQLAPL